MDFIDRIRTIGMQIHNWRVDIETKEWTKNGAPYDSASQS